jgi:hypothetical protein
LVEDGRLGGDQDRRLIAVTCAVSVATTVGALQRQGVPEGRTTGDAELGKDPVEITPHCARRQAEPLADLLVAQTGRGELSDLTFLR